MRPSRIKAKLQQGEPVLVTTLHLIDPSVYELTSLMGFDGIWMDLEHHTYSMETATSLMRAARVFTWDVEQVTAIIKEMLSDLPDGAQTQPLDPAQVRWMLGKLRRQVLRGKDPEEISQTVLAFFKDNPALWLDPTDFEGMLEVMRDRIDREETILFPIYEELTDGQ